MNGSLIQQAGLHNMAQRNQFKHQNQEINMNNELRIFKNDLDTLKQIIRIVSTYFSSNIPAWLLYIVAQSTGQKFLLGDVELNMVELEEKVVESQLGIKLTLSEVTEIINNLTVVDDFYIVFPKEENVSITKASDINSIKGNSLVIIDFFDSSYIDVFCQNEKVIADIKLQLA